MAVFRFPLFLILLLVAVFPAQGASIRPMAGIGILFLRPFVPERADELKVIPLYAEPGIGRLAELDAARFPSLDPAVTQHPGQRAVAVLEKRREWLRIAYDDAGREGWIRLRRFWDYLPWMDFLPGRSARLLPGLRETLTRLRREPSNDSASSVRFAPDRVFRIVSIRDDWARVTADGAVDGWLRWRDADGRLMFALEAPVP